MLLMLAGRGVVELSCLVVIATVARCWLAFRFFPIPSSFAPGVCLSYCTLSNATLLMMFLMLMLVLVLVCSASTGGHALISIDR